MRKLVPWVLIASLAACTPVLSPNDPATAQDQQGMQGVGIFLTAIVAVTVIGALVSGGHVSGSSCDIHALDLGDSCVCQSGYHGDGNFCVEDTTTTSS